jgi:hypothetical protein
MHSLLPSATAKETGNDIHGRWLPQTPNVAIDRRAGVRAVWADQDQSNGEFAMNMPAKLFAVALLAAGTWSLAVPAGAAPITAPLSLQNATSPVETVQWRRGWGWGPGIAAGLIIGGAIAASQYPYYGGYGYAPYGYGYAPAPVYGAPVYGPPVYAAPGPGYVAGPAGDAVAYCSRRYRSYDPASGTFLGYDGLRHPCP